MNKAFIDIRLRPGIATLLEDDRATAKGNCTTNFVKIGPAVPEICSRTARQTN